MATGRVSKPCVRCLQEPKAPGGGQKFCIDCKNLMSLTAKDRYIEKQNRKMKLEREGRGLKRVLKSRCPEGTKWCPRCSQFIAVENFRGKRASYCSECQGDANYEAQIRSKYGITIVQYYEILESQGNMCAICLRVLKTRRYHVDHNHRTGEVRGLLCSPCNNRLLGTARDDPAMLRRAADYLEEPPARAVLSKVPDQPNS